MTSGTQPKSSVAGGRLQIAAGANVGLRDRLARSFPTPGKINWVVLLLLVTAAGVIQFLMLRPPFPSDSLAYFGWAENLSSNEISHGPTRFGVLVPVRVAIALFGVSEGAYYAIPFVLSLLLVAGTYVVGLKLTGRHVVGGAAAITMVSSTLVLELSSQILPDTFATAWFVLGLAFLLAARGSAYRPYWIGCGAAAIGMAYLCREYVVFMAPLLLFLAWVDRWKFREWLVVILVLTGVLLGEMLLSGILFGDPLARFQALAGFAERGASGESAFLSAYGEGATRWTVLRRGPGALAVYVVGRLLLLGVPAAFVGAVVDRRRRGLWCLLLFWIAALWVPMVILAGIFDPQTPRIRDNHVRYWYLIIPALYLIAATVLFALANSFRNRGLAAVAGSLAVLIAVGTVASDFGAIQRGLTFRAVGATQWDEVRDWLRADGASVDRIFTDSRMARVLPLYTTEVFGQPIWDGEIEVFEERGEFTPVTKLDGAILLHELGIRYLRNRSLQVPESYFDPGPGWEIAARRGDGTLTLVAPTGDQQAVAQYLTFVDNVTIDELLPTDLIVAGDATVTTSGTVLTIGPDPQIFLKDTVTYASGDLLVIEIDAPTSTTAQLFWRHSDGSFSEADSLRQGLAADDEYVVFDLSAVPPGSVIRIDPSDAAGFTVATLMLVSPRR